MGLSNPGILALSDEIFGMMTDDEACLLLWEMQYYLVTGKCSVRKQPMGRMKENRAKHVLGSAYWAKQEERSRLSSS
jgi:hypothetical protein